MYNDDPLYLQGRPEDRYNFEYMDVSGPIVHKMTALRSQYISLLQTLNTINPSRERERAIDSLEISLMYGIKALCVEDKNRPPQMVGLVENSRTL